MLRRLAVLATLLLGTAPAPAGSRTPEWRPSSLQVIALEDADTVVTATLERPRVVHGGEAEHWSADLRVISVLCGDVRAGSVIKLRWEKSKVVIDHAPRHEWERGHTAIWLLTRGAEGDYRSFGWNGRYSSIFTEAIRTRLLAHPHVLRPSLLIGEPPPEMTLLFRNPGLEPMDIPHVEWKEGKLWVARDVEVTVLREDPPGKWTALTGSPVVRLPWNRTRTLEPGETSAVSLPGPGALGMTTPGTYQVKIQFSEGSTPAQASLLLLPGPLPVVEAAP